MREDRFQVVLRIVGIMVEHGGPTPQAKLKIELILAPLASKVRKEVLRAVAELLDHEIARRKLRLN